MAAMEQQIRFCMTPDGVRIAYATLGEATAPPLVVVSGKYTGQNKVNPMAMMLSGMLMLRHIGEREAGDRLERAIAEVIQEGKSVTYDMKANREDPTAVGTSQVADAIIEKLEASKVGA